MGGGGGCMGGGGGCMGGGGVCGGLGGRGMEINEIKSKNPNFLNISRFYYYLF